MPFLSTYQFNLSTIRLATLVLRLTHAALGEQVHLYKIKQMKQIQLALLIILCWSAVSNAQTPNDVEAKNQIKINIVPVFLTNTLELSYERLLKPDLSFGGSLSFSARNSQPLYLRLGRVSELSFSGHRFRGFAIMQQLKWYPQLGSRKAPHGFYMGGLLRYQSFNYGASIQYQDVSSTTVEVALDASLTGVGIGMEMGYQIKFKNNFLLDFSFFGPRITHNTFLIELNSEVSNEFLAELSDEVNNAIGFGIFDPNIALSRTVAKRFTFVGFRYAISVGYFF